MRGARPRAQPDGELGRGAPARRTRRAGGGDVGQVGPDAPVAAGGKTYEWGVWGESLEPRAGTTTLATYADHYYKGNVAAVTRRVGRGSVTYVGVESLGGELERDLLRGVFERAGVTVRDLPNGFHVEWREGFWVATNFTERTLPAPRPPGAKILPGTPDVPPAGVTVWQE